jgi:DNA repair exonuclease SbcCD ATPase subunit
MKFGAGWLSAGVAALLLATGCKEGRSVTVDEQGNEQASASAAVEQAQGRSEEAFDKAESAQKEAGDQQQEAARAQQRVEDARRELTEAETQAQAELQQAQQAQQQAQQTHQQAQQTVAEAQRSALEAQRQQQAELAQQQSQQAQQAQQQAQQTQQQAQQPVAQAPMPSAPQPSAQAQSDQFIVGQVLTASEDEVMVSVRGEPQLRLQVEPNTQIIVNGRQGRAADIQEGSQVRASYRDSEGEQKAVRIEVTSSAQPGMPATPESGESSPGVQPQPLEQ